MALPPGGVTVQKVLRLVGNQSRVNELAFTARQFDGNEALKLGMSLYVLCTVFVSSVVFSLVMAILK